MGENIAGQFADFRRRLESIELERARLAADLATFEDSLKAQGAGINFKATNARIQKFKLSAAWAVILHRLGEYKHFNARNVAVVARELVKAGIIGKEQTRGGIRAQLSLLTKKKIVKRLGGGNYRVADDAKLNLWSHRAVRQVQSKLSSAPTEFGPEFTALAQKNGG